MCAPGATCGCGGAASALGSGAAIVVTGAVAVGGLVAFLAAHLLVLALAAVALPVATLAVVCHLRRYVLVVHRQAPRRPGGSRGPHPRSPVPGRRSTPGWSRPSGPGRSRPVPRRPSSPGLPARRVPGRPRPRPSWPWAAITCTSTAYPRPRLPRCSGGTVTPWPSTRRTWPPSPGPGTAPGGNGGSAAAGPGVPGPLGGPGRLREGRFVIRMRRIRCAGRGVSCSLAGRLVAVRLPRNEAGGRLVRRPGYAGPVRRVAVTWH